MDIIVFSVNSPLSITIEKYFPELEPEKLKKLYAFAHFVTQKNQEVNLISRKDIEHLIERHILHSLFIAKIINIGKGKTVLDIGTGGGFPGIPLAILFPEAQFTLADSIGKKILAVNQAVEVLELKNAIGLHCRAETIKGTFDYITSRAVTNLPDFVKLAYKLIKKPISKGGNSSGSGILYLKGGDFDEELQQVSKSWVYNIYNISDHYDEPFFETKKMIHLVKK